MKINKTQRGFSLVEMIVYIAILSFVFSALVTSANSIIKTYTTMRTYEEIAHTGTVTLERLTREVRRASNVDTLASTLFTNPGVLILNTRDWSGNSTVASVSLVNGRIVLQEGGTPSPLSASGVTVTNLVFTYLENPQTQGVLIEFTVEKAGAYASTTKQFRTFTVLDG